MNYITQYWGKGIPKFDGPPWHPAAFHCLDVAAVAREYLIRHPIIADTLVKLHGGDREDVIRLIVALVALHDLGKFTSGFQKLAPDIRARLAPDADEGLDWRYGGPGGRHDAIGMVLWDEIGHEFLPSYNDATLMAPLMSAVFGHHGSPMPGCLPQGWSLDHVRSPADRTAALGFARDVVDLLADGRLVPPTTARGAARFSLALAAVTNLCDWIGSTQEWFRYTAPDGMDLGQYWNTAKARAVVAVAQSRVIPPPPARNATFRDLFPKISNPTPLQRWAEGCRPHGQNLVLVEEGTGGGKTEAAQMVASRNMDAGRSSSLAMLLPTTATAGGMAERLARIHWKQFDGSGDPPSLMLAHGRVTKDTVAKLRKDGADVESWISDDRRLALLAAVTVCTADQALLAAMPVRFAAVRIAGLLGKTLVMDEVHSFDDYTGTLLARLLRLHAATGGSAVLLSATLPAALKQVFVEEFARGGGFELGDRSCIYDPAYPLVTILDARGLSCEEPGPTSLGARPKRVRFARSVEDMHREILDVAGRGRCALWCRNTVDDAIAAAEELMARHDDVTLYHSRFPECERERIEQEILHRFGKGGDSAERAGGIVVATQIIAESHDIDFDLTFSDLKPADEIIQTAGRGGRHSRAADGTLLSDGEPDQRGQHEIVILSPPTDGEPSAGWYASLFPRAAMVYRDLGMLWRTAEVLEKVGEIRYPDTIRTIIEYAHGSIDAPEAFARSVLRVDGGRLAERSLARRNAIDPDVGYVYDDATYGSDERVPTRLGDSCDIFLLRERNGVVAGYDGRSWTSGRVRLRAGNLDVAVLAEAAEAPRFAEFRKLFKFSFPVLVSETNEGVVPGRRGPQPFLVSPILGIVFLD